MLFFITGEGTMVRADSTRIFQGSNNVTQIQVVSPYSGTGMAVAFTLPNGIQTNYFPMQNNGVYTAQNLAGSTAAPTTLYYYTLPLAEAITQYVGTVGVSVNVTSFYSTGETTTATNNLTSYTAQFTVEYSGLPNVASEPTASEWQQIIDLLNTYYGNLTGQVKQAQSDITTLQGQMSAAQGNISALQSGLATANGNIAANTAAIKGNSADIATLQEGMSAAQSDISDLQGKTAIPLMTDWTVNAENNMAVNSYNNGTTRYVSFPTPTPSGAQRITFATAVSFTADDFVQQEDGTYTLTLTATQTARTNNLFTANLEVTDGTGYAVSADCFVKNADGSVTISGIDTPFAGRLITITAGQNGTVWHYGTAIVGTGTQTSTDLTLRASVLVGDFYLNTETSQCYVCTSLPENASTWLYLANLQGAQGEKGDAGAPFAIYKTYGSIAAMNADAANVPDGRFVLIETGNVDDPTNSQLFVRTTEGTSAFEFVTDLSGAQGIKGDNGTTFTPSVDTNGNLSWSNDGGLPNPTTVNIKGQKGDTGLAATIQIGTVTTLPAGGQATVENVGDENNAVFNFALPQGAQGETGEANVVANPSSDTNIKLATIDINGTTYNITQIISAVETVSQIYETNLVVGGRVILPNNIDTKTGDLAIVKFENTAPSGESGVLFALDEGVGAGVCTLLAVISDSASGGEGGSGGGLTKTEIPITENTDFVSIYATIKTLSETNDIVSIEYARGAEGGVEVSAVKDGITTKYGGFVPQLVWTNKGELQICVLIIQLDDEGTPTGEMQQATILFYEPTNPILYRSGNTFEQIQADLLSTISVIALSSQTPIAVYSQPKSA
jgi:hypothetical protein